MTPTTQTHSRTHTPNQSPLNVYTHSWHYVLKPSITREPWTEEEDRAILHYQAQLGNRWSQVAKFVPGALVSMCCLIG